MIIGWSPGFVTSGKRILVGFLLTRHCSPRRPAQQCSSAASGAEQVPRTFEPKKRRRSTRQVVRVASRLRRKGPQWWRSARRNRRSAGSLSRWAEGAGTSSWFSGHSTNSEAIPARPSVDPTRPYVPTRRSNGPSFSQLFRVGNVEVAAFSGSPIESASTFCKYTAQTALMCTGPRYT